MVAAALVNITDVVAWLEQTEGRISGLYARAADLCRDDVSFSGFLAALAEDEQSHAGFMSAAAEQLRAVRRPHPLGIVLDQTTTGHIDDLLERFEHFLTRAKVSTKGVVEYIARAETCELNAVFLYIVDECRRTGREGERIAGEIRRHLTRIQSFIDSLPRDMKPSVDIRLLPRVGQARLLIVDDDAPLRGLLAAILARRADVDTAAGGDEAITRLQEHFHDGIISDVRMPGMDGLELYRRAIEFDEHLQGRFLFYADRLTRKSESYLKRNNLRFLRQPFRLDDLTQAVNQILGGETPPTPRRH